MSLEKLLKGKSLTLLGMNSGTSIDALDMTAMKFDRRGAGVSIKFLAGKVRLIPPRLRQRLSDLCDNRPGNLEEAMALDNQFGRFLGKSAATYVVELAEREIRIDAIASHGQTVRHLPDRSVRSASSGPRTLQLGSIDFIASQTGKACIGDFRQADIASGGEGAPITIGAMRRLLASPHESRLIVNIGGMANYFYFPSRTATVPLSGADCGPGNSLCDILSRKLFDKKFDRNGRIASRGRLSKRLLAVLLADPFFQKKQASTGRESFGTETVAKMIKLGKRFCLQPADLLRTAAELTTNGIALRVWPVVRKDRSLRKLYLTGGGRKNRFFVERLSRHLTDLDIRPIDELGIDGDEER
jgi:anhydro-N-acetylmuramic acid kinase